MGILSETELKKQIRENRLAKVYLLYGEESYLVAQYARQLIAKAAPPDFTEFNLQYFDGEATVDEIDNAVEALPVLSERKCVVVNNYGADNVSANTAAKMEQLLLDPPETCVLIFKMTTVEVNPKKSAKWRNFIKAVSAVGEVVEVPRREESVLVRFLISYAQQRDCLLSPELARVLLRSCGNDLNRLTAEMEKVCAFSGGGELTAEIIEAVSSRTSEAVIYKMTDALTAQDFDAAYQILDRLFFQREEPIVLLSAISNAYVDLYRARAALDSGVNAMNLAAQWDYRGLDFKLKNAMRVCRAYSLAQLREVLSCLYQADRELKSSRTDGRILIERTIAKILLILTKRR